MNSKLREGAIVLPKSSPDGTDVYEVAMTLARELSKTFGGVTITDGFGFDATTPDGEEVAIFTVAYDDGLGGADARFAQAAFRAWVRASQRWGYIRFANGEVHLVELANAIAYNRLPLPWAANRVTVADEASPVSGPVNLEDILNGFETDADRQPQQASA